MRYNQMKDKIETPIVEEKATDVIETSSINEKANDFKMGDNIPKEQPAVSEDLEEEGELYNHFANLYANAFTVKSFTSKEQLEVTKLNVQMSLYGELKRIADSLERTEQRHFKAPEVEKELFQ